GLLCDKALWQPMITRLNQAYGDDFAAQNCLVADLTLDENVAAMAARVLAAAPPQFVLVSLSMGGYVAFEIMRQAGFRVAKLALFDTNPHNEPQDGIKRRQILIRQAQSDLQSNGFRGVTKRLLPNLIHERSINDPDVAGVVMDMAIRVGRTGFVRQQHAIINRPDSRPNLPLISIPTLVGVGAQDAITPPIIAQAMAAAIPGARLVEFPECGHLPPLECPDLAFAALAELLR
ncbi:MAG: alpha/beta fold hydrolase, partial [Alphaproteobacteria bacterium]|nr:alpha/beta fold hydrolase [Alphaproteobacteria bacterium]